MIDRVLSALDVAVVVVVPDDDDELQAARANGPATSSRATVRRCDRANIMTSSSVVDALGLGHGGTWVVANGATNVYGGAP
jgi:hypothetical protein